MNEVKFKIFATNWINVFGVFAAIYLSVVVNELIDQRTTGSKDFFSTFFLAGFYLVIYYGFVLLGFIPAIFILDMLLLDKRRKLLYHKLIIEWVIISIPFFYIFIKEDGGWILLVGIAAFLITQMLRGKAIIKNLQQISN